MASIKDIVARGLDARVGELVEWLRIPSVSALPAQHGEVRKACAWVAEYLRGMGFPQVEVVETAGLPLVVAEWCPYPDKPTLLFYGHADVQPADPVEKWVTPAFEPDIRDGKIYARGANDDKGQCMVWLGALKVLLERDGKLPVNVKVLVESEEEVGSENIGPYVQAQSERLACDAVVVCDTAMYSTEHPAICTSLRGLVYTEVVVTGARTDMHSGLYGGVAPNPLHALALLISRLKGEDGVINIPELQAAIPEVTEDERAFWAADPVGLEADLKRDMGVGRLYGENGHSAHARIGVRPTLEVHGIIGGFTDEGSKTVIPATAKAKISLRLPPTVADPAEALEWFKAAVARHMPEGYTVDVHDLSGGAGMDAPWDAPLMRKARAAMEQVYGVAPAPMRMGGSVPVCAVFDRVLKAPVLLLGFGLPDDDLHAPNEKYNLGQLQKGMETMALFVDEVGRSGV